MKALFLTAGALLACSFSFAQNRIIDVREAHPGKDLTMEEAIYRGVGYARGPRLFLQADGSVTDKPASRPQGRYALYQEKGSLYAKDFEKDLNFVIAPSDGPDLVYGETVSRNEFGINDGWYMSPDSSAVAF